MALVAVRFDSYERRGQTVIEEEYAITRVSPLRPAPSNCCGKSIDIENRLHWVRDVTSAKIVATSAVEPHLTPWPVSAMPL